MEDRYLIFGNGYLGNRFKEFLDGKSILSDMRIHSSDDALTVIDQIRPTVVINAAGHTGKPNVDACEMQKSQTFAGNVSVPYNIAEACSKRKLFMIHLSSGCIYEGNGHNGRGFSEEDVPNFRGSFYSITKSQGEEALKPFLNVGQIRLRIPFEGRKNPRNLLDKLLSYISNGFHVLDAPNSISYIPDLLYITQQLAERRAAGIFNVVNEGAMTHDQLLREYQKVSGRQLSYKLITPADLDKRTAARRSNCVLSVEKLKSLGISVPSVESAIERGVAEYVEQERI